MAERIVGGRGGVRAVRHTPELVQRDELVLNRFAVDLWQPARKRLPLLDSLASLAGILEQSPEIDIGRVEIGLQPDAFARGVDRPQTVSPFGESDAVVEISGMQRGVGRIAGDPTLV